MAPKLVAMSVRSIAGFLLGLTSFVGTSPAQLQDRGASDAIRVTLSVNQDGSRTSYEFDDANRKAVAMTTSATGKPLGKIRYDLDEAGRFITGKIYAADGKFRFKTQYKYDAAGRLIEETQLTKDDAVQNRIVYSYNQDGKQTGYAVYDSAGKLLGQTTPTSPKAKKK